MLKTTTNFGMTVSADDKLNYYQAMAKKNIQDQPIPKNLEEAVQTVIDCTSETIKEKIEDGEIDPSAGHMGIGMWMRNNWGLWGGSKLQEWFHKKGIRHADDMSGIILTTVGREIRGDDWELQEQVDYYREYWLDKGVDPDKIGTEKE